MLSAIISALLLLSDTALDFNPNSTKHLDKITSEALEYSFSSVELASIDSGIVPISRTIFNKLSFVNLLTCSVKN